MGIFSEIWDRITVSEEERREHAEKRRQRDLPTPAPGQTSSTTVQVDVEEVLKQKAAAKGGGGNWRTSIVDLLKLLDLDSSLDSRKELAMELNVNAGTHGSAEQNIALSRAVGRKLAENSGRVPDSLKVRSTGSLLCSA